MRIGVDVGGTKIRVGLIGNDAKVLTSKCAPCPCASGKQEVLDFIAGMVDEYFSPEIESVGIAVPAIVDELGIVRDCVNIPSWDVVDLKGDFEKRFNVPVSVRNDSNCYALGVKCSDEGRGFDNIVAITLGTGVGSGIIIGGQIYSGVDSCAGEIGEIHYKDSNYEQYCSSQFFKKLGTSGKDAAMAAEKNDPEALALWDEFGANIGELLSLVVLAYSPQAIFLGGSVSKAYPYFEKGMRERLKLFPYREVIDKLSIIPMPGSDAILIGATM